MLANVLTFQKAVWYSDARLQWFFFNLQVFGTEFV